MLSEQQKKKLSEAIRELYFQVHRKVCEPDGKTIRQSVLANTLISIVDEFAATTGIKPSVRDGGKRVGYSKSLRSLESDLPVYREKLGLVVASNTDEGRTVFYTVESIDAAMKQLLGLTLLSITAFAEIREAMMDGEAPIFSIGSRTHETSSLKQLVEMNEPHSEILLGIEEIRTVLSDAMKRLEYLQQKIA